MMARLLQHVVLAAILFALAVVAGPLSALAQTPTLSSVSTTVLGAEAVRFTATLSAAPSDTTTVFFRYQEDGSGTWILPPAATTDTSTAVLGVSASLSGNTTYTVQASLDSNYATVVSDSFTTGLYDYALYGSRPSTRGLYLLDPTDPDSTDGGFGQVGSFATGLSNGRALLVQDGLLWVVDVADEELWRVDPDDPDSEEGTLGSVGTFPSTLTHATGMAPVPDSAHLYVLDTEGKELWLIDSTDPDNETGAFGLMGTLPSNLAKAVGLAIDDAGDLYTIDATNKELWRIDPNDVDSETGNYGEVGAFPAAMGTPVSMTMDANDDLLVLARPALWRINTETPAQTTGVYGEVGDLSTGSILSISTSALHTPIFFLDPVARTIAENSASGTNVGAAVAATHPGDATLSYTLTGTGADNFAIDGSTGQITVGTDATIDFETTSSYTLTVTAADGPLSAAVTVNITVTNLDEPGVVTLSTDSPVAGTAITATLADPDGGQTGGSWRWDRSTDQSNWTEIAGARATSYTPVTADVGHFLRVRVAYLDNVGVAIEHASAVTANAVGNRAPTFADGATTMRSIAENSAAGTNVGAAVTATDPDGHTVTYTLGGTDASSFAINASTGQITVGADATIDFETTASYTVTVTASDGQTPPLTATITVTINVTNVNEAGTVTLSTGAPVVGTAITATLTDPDGSISIFTWRWQRSTDGLNRMNIGGQNERTYTPVDGDVGFFLHAVAIYNDAVANNNSATANTAAQVVAAAVNRAPTFDDGATTTRSIAENSASGTNVGEAVSATDMDDHVLTYTLGGTDASSFALDGSTGQITTATTLDYETTSSYSVTVEASDGQTPALTDSITVTINVTNVDEAGTVTLSTNSPAVGTAITATLTDPDGSISSTTWQWARSTDGNVWADISEGTAASYTPTRADARHHVRARASYTDGQGAGKTTQAATTNRVPNQAPVFSEHLTNRSVAEDTTIGDNVGAAVSATDEDDLTYWLLYLPSDDSATFSIDNTGQITVGLALDFETQSSYNVSVRASDGTLTDTIAVSITVTNVDEAGTVTLSTDSPAEGTDITATLTDPDGSVSGTTWQWARSTDGNAWADISGGTAASYTPVAGDVGYRLRATASYTDGQGAGKSAQAATTGAATQPNRAPVFADGAMTTRSIAENSASGTNVGEAVSATDMDDHVLTYTLGGTDASSFALDGSTGQITTATTLDYETTSSYSVTVEASDGQTPALTDSITVTINVTNVDEAGTVTLSTNSPAVGTAITATLTDPDGSISSTTWQWARSTDGNVWADISEGTAASYTPVAGDIGYRLRATASYTDGQGAGKSALASTTGSATQPNRAPAFSANSATRSVAENSAAGTNVGAAVTATDADDDSITYSLTGADASSFAINSETGQITVGVGTSLDYETKTSYSVTVSASDGTLSGTIAVTIAITDVREAGQLGQVVITTGSSGDDYGYTDNYGLLVSGSFPGELFNDGNSRTVNAVYEDAAGYWYLTYSGGTANNWLSDQEQLDEITLEVHYADGVDFRSFVLGGFIDSRTGQRTLRLDPPIHSRDWDTQSGDNISLVFHRHRVQAVSAPTPDPLTDPSGEPDSFVEFLAERTPGGPIVAQALIVILVYAGFLFRSPSDPWSILIAAVVLIMTPWVPVFWDFGEPVAAALVGLNVAAGAYAYKSWAAGPEG